MKGVTYCRKAKKWRVRIGVPGERNKKINIGSYRTEWEAEEACKEWHHRNPLEPRDCRRRKLSAEKIDLSEQLKDIGRITSAWESLSSDHKVIKPRPDFPHDKFLHGTVLNVGPLKIIFFDNRVDIHLRGKKIQYGWIEYSNPLPTNAGFVYAQILTHGFAPRPLIRRNRQLILREWDNFIRIVDAPVSMEVMHEQYDYDQ
jgi:hypothetical protein